MKKLVYLCSVALAGIALASCAGNQATLNEGDQVSKKDIYGLNNEQDVIKYGQEEVLFKKDSTIPYINLAEGVELMSVVRSNNLDDKKYKYSLAKDNNNFVITNETGAKCTLDKTNQTLIYDDYDKFVSIVPDFQKPLSIMTIKKNNKTIKQVSSDYTAGKAVTVDLKPYSKLDIYTSGDKCYIPLSVFNSVLFNTYENVSVGFNGNSLFIIPNDSLTNDTLGIPVPTKLAEKFREGAQKTSITQEYLDYYYQSLCFDFNYEYGLKDKFNSFDEYLTAHYKNDILSTDPKKIDSNTALALTWLGDNHTALTEFSNMYEYGENSIDKTKINPIKQNWEEMSEALSKAKQNAGIHDGLDYRGDTVFVSFEKFTNVDPDTLYNSTTDKSDDNDDFTGIDDIPGLDFANPFEYSVANDTAKLFNTLYKDLTGSKKETIKNIVIDLTTNGGGAANGLVYALSTLIGNVYFDMTNPLSNARNHQVYMADINADGKIDANDKPLCDLGFKIYFLNSRYSFSSANAMPVVAKINKPNIIMLGDKTAGGPCAVRGNVTPIGSVISSSSLSTISKLENGKYVNIDGGIDADFKLTEEQMLDREYIKNNLSKWVK